MTWRDQIAEFKGALEITDPVKGGTPLRIGWFGASGGGKSVTAGMTALSLAGRNGGLILWVDGEGNRSGWAIDIVAGIAANQWGGTKDQYVKRFKVIRIAQDFNPLRVVAAIETAVEQKFSVCLLDIMTQLWSGAGGYLDMKESEINRMAGDDDAKRERVKSVATMRVKPVTHSILKNALIDCPLHLVMCFQASPKVHKEPGKPMEWDRFESPIQEPQLLQTMLICGRVYADTVKLPDGTLEAQGGFVNFRGDLKEGKKTSHPEVTRLIPRDGEQWTLAHGEALAKWAAGTGEPAIQPAQKRTLESAKGEIENLGALKKELWKMLENVLMGAHGKEGLRIVNQFLWDEIGMSPNQFVELMNAEELKLVVEQVKEKRK